MTGAQLLIWFTSGVLMSFLRIEQVRGEHLVEREAVTPIRFSNPAAISGRATAPVETSTRHMVGCRPVTGVATSKGAKLVNANTGDPRPMKRLLAGKPKVVRGLAIVGMPIGSPGMEVPGVEADRYTVVGFGTDRPFVCARH